MPLHIDYRPTNLNEVIGNDGIKESIRSVFSREDKPHVVLMTGPKGSGKTTLARIIASMTGCSPDDIQEYNCAMNNGIDTVRQISENAMYSPMSGGVKFYILDECFSKGTKVKTPNGDMNIEDIRVGDSIYSAYGVDKVTNTFQNKVELNRVLNVTLSNGSVMTCSNGHEFFTNRGWVHAEDLLKNDLIYPFDCNTVLNTTLQMEGIYDRDSMSSMCHRNGVFGEHQREVSKEVLFNEMCGNKQRECLVENTRESCKDKSGCECVLSDTIRGEEEKGIFGENENQQSIKDGRCSRKDENIEKNKRDVGLIQEQSWWEREGSDNSTAAIGDGVGLGDGSCRTDKRPDKWLSKSLQVGHRQSKIEGGCGGERADSLHSGGYAKRLEEAGEVEILRVESVELYQRGNNDESFQGVISDKEIDQGYVILYDLEVENDPSFFANNVLVHNCHALTKGAQGAQNSLLKILEDTPKHVYFVLCTTDPEKMLPALVSRCMKFEVKSLATPQMMKLLVEIVESEGMPDYPKSVLSAIIKAADGCPRQALILLDSVIDIQDEKGALAAIADAVATETASIDVCRLLLEPASKSKWSDMAYLIKNLGDDPEKMRYAILGYMASVLVSDNCKNPDFVSNVIDCFTESFMYSGKAGLFNACFQACKL